MNIAFVDATPMRYGIGALREAPLGGSQSALLTLAEALAAAGHEVAVAGMHFEHGTRSHGVLGLELKRALREGMPPAEVAVSVNTPLTAAALLRFPRRPRLVHWHKNDAQSPDAGTLAAAAAHVERFVFCSHWQAGAFIASRGVPAERAAVIENPLAPMFCGLYGDGEPIAAAKDPELLFYASAPHRGLEALVRAIFPWLRRRRPGLRLEVYSGFALDQGMRIAPKAGVAPRDFEALLAQCAQTPGVTLERGIAKPELAARMKRAAALCYPCNFRETSCHVALEAMAAGCLVSATAAGALPETTAGHAALAPFREPEGYDPARFAGNTLRLLEALEREPQATEERLRHQVAQVTARHAPAAIARRWLALLGG